MYREQVRQREGRKVRIVISWVPGHRGITGNEDADGIAKGATLEEKDSRIKIPPTKWRILKEEMWQLTQDRIQAEGIYKGAKYFSTCYDREKKKAMVPWKMHGQRLGQFN